MEIRVIDADGARAAAELAAAEHARLRAALGFMPGRDGSSFTPRIEWMTRNGVVLGLYEGASLLAFLGGFILEDYRNLGKGAFCPDWCHGAAPIARAFEAYRALYRELAPRFIEMGTRVHAACAYSTDAAACEALSLTGFGRIVMDAARPTAELASELAGARPVGPEGSAASLGGYVVRAALPADAAALAGLDAMLASHIAASPVLMPRTHGGDEGQWVEWLGRESAVAMVAESEGRLVGFIKAEEPQFDVTFSVQDERTLAIDGMFVEGSIRGRGVGRSLLAALVGHALEAGKSLVSVDCETTNPEAYAFWSARFRPVTWSFERRI
jgi:GNAT superfamily N-acetyltransferase